MTLADVLQGGGLVVSGAALKMLLDYATRVWAARNGRTEIAPQPLEVRRSEEFVTRHEFEKHVSDNARDHENLFARQSRSDRELGEIHGILSGMRDDLSEIKGKLFKTRG